MTEWRILKARPTASTEPTAWKFWCGSNGPQL